MKHRKTERGFRIDEFIDRSGYECSLQKSSIATEDCIWLGVNEPNAKIFIPYGNPAWNEYPLPDNVSCTTRMHLSQDQVRDLLPALQHFAKTGELPT